MGLGLESKRAHWRAMVAMGSEKGKTTRGRECRDGEIGMGHLMEESDDVDWT